MNKKELKVIEIRAVEIFAIIMLVATIVFLIIKR
jgi:hypothetical protein